jgi:hypothetical protein
MMLTPRRLFIAILFIALFVMTAREIADPDFWWHLSTGKYIVETRTVPRVDIFSGTVASQPWVAHEWLSEVFSYALFALGSFPALILTFSAIIALAFAFVYARCVGKPYIAAFALLLAALATAPTWGVRPQMISLLLMSVFLWVLDRWTGIASRAAAEQSPATAAIASSHKPLLAMTRSKLIWILVPLMILWVNLHSGYALGLAVIAVYLFGEIVSRLAARPSPPLTRHTPLVTLSLVFTVCLLVVPLNPNGATMYAYPFETLTSHAMQAYIQEWFSPDFHLIEFQPFAWLLLATLASLGLSGKRVPLTQTLLLIGTGYAGLRSARNIPIFALVAAPILAEHLWHIIETRGWAAALASDTPTPRRMAILNWAILVIALLAGAARVGMVLANQNPTERAKFPAAAVDFLQAQHVAGTIFNSYDWGGYLIWRLYPRARVFIDGRADVYGDAFIEQVYLPAYRGEANWQSTLERYNVGTILIAPTAPLAAQVARDPTWKRVYADAQALVLEKSNLESSR